jgi:hypothetical protein
MGRAILLFTTVVGGALSAAAADPTANAGPDRTATWPELRVDLAGVAANGTPQWYQVSGPATARLRSGSSAATTVALPQPGTYVFRLRVTGGGKTADDDVQVVVNPRAALGAGATAIDHLTAAVKPAWRDGHGLSPLNRHDWGISTALYKTLASDWRYNWLLPVDPAWGEAHFSDPGYQEYHLAQEYAAHPGAYRVTALLQNVMANTYAAKPTGWPDSALLRDAGGAFIDFDTGTAVKYKLSPLAPDAVFTAVGTNLGQAFKTIFTTRGITVDAIADQGEWGLGVIGWEWDAGTNGPNIGRDPRVVAAANADPVAKGDLWRFASIHNARLHRLIKQAFYQAAQLPASVPYISYTDTGFGTERGRWNGWPAWGWYLEDCASWIDVPTVEFYLQGRSWDYQSGGMPTDFMTMLLNDASGRKAVLGRTAGFVPWMSAGWDPAAASPYVTPRDRYTGFLKMVFAAGAKTVFQDDYNQDNRIDRDDAAIGATAPPKVWGWMAAAHVHALFSHLSSDLLASELVSAGGTHPFTTDDPTSPRPWLGFHPTGDNGAWVMARKVDGASRWILTAFAALGVDRTVAVTIPGLGAVSVRARAAGSVYTATVSSGTPVLTWLDEQDPLEPTRLWFASGRGVAATAPPVIDTTPPATPAAPTVAGNGTARPTLSGTSEAGATITIRLDGTVIGTTTADGSGAWSWTPSSDLPGGGHQITVTASDAGGNTSGVSPATTITVANSGGNGGGSSGGGSGSTCGLGSGAAVFSGLLMSFVALARFRRARRDSRLDSRVPEPPSSRG